MQVKERYKEKILSAITKILPDCKIYLFGSRASKGKISFSSDIDVSIDNNKPLNIKTICKLEDAIDDLDIPLDIDLVDFRNVSSEFKKEIINTGIEWKS